MIIFDLKDTEPLIYYTAMARYKEQKGVSGKYSEICHFIWDKTREGVHIWGRVQEGNFKPFYEFYNKRS